MTEHQILVKLTGVCAKGEHCLYDMRTKMDRWGIDDATQENVLKYLVGELYIDEERYARSFINDKAKYNRWGRKKIEEALWMKKIPKDIYEPILNDMDDESYEEMLLPLLRSKIKTVKGDSDYDIRMKLVRFALQRGFSYEQAEHCIESLIPKP